GTSGTSGASGSYGSSGTSASSGSSGSSGTSGTSGVSSAAGTSGISGGVFSNQPNYLVYTTGTVTVNSASFLYVDTTNSRLGINTTAPVQSLQLGTNAAQTTTPSHLSLGAYYSSTAATPGNAKLRLWDDNAGSIYGIGISAAQMEYFTPSTAGHFFYSNGSATCRLNVNSNGSVGISTTGPSATYALDVNGQAHATCFPTSSDVRFKKNIVPLEKALEKVLALRGVQYEWNEFVNSVRNGYALNVPIIGMIAQEVEKVIPQIVGTWKLNDKLTDAKSLEYQRIVPYLVEAIKEQQNQINQLKFDVNYLKNK
ncbi:tail fiber domain-containing protein, partial [archaeon]|nr:tail fiber domain-containing protein [archaeon]NDB54392.1 tail fiber domain-containing protein [archaeon]